MRSGRGGLEPTIPRAQRGGRPRKTDMQAAVNPILYLLRTDRPWRCNNIRPSAATLTTFFNQLHSLYPNAKLGFGEIGFPNKVGSNIAVAEAMINYYYGLNITTPGYIGGYFWWHYYEDMLPYTTKPLWQTLNAAFSAMPVTPRNGGRGRL